MASLRFIDRFREFLGSRRFAWILLITLGVLILFYFIFITLFFNPFESKLEDTAAVVPAEMDWFLRWRDAGDQFGEFPVPAVWDDVRASPAYEEARASGALLDLGARWGVNEIMASLGEVGQYLPAGLSLKGDFLREVAVAGKGAMKLDSSFDGLVMLRCSFKVKAGLAFLGFDFVREQLPESVQIESEGSGVYKLPQFEPFGFQDAYLARIRDVLILTSRREYITRALELQTRSGQESLATSSLFHDNVSAWLAPGDRPIEIFSRWQALAPHLGVLPDPNSTGMTSRALGRFFRTDLLRYLAGYLQVGENLRLRASGDMDTSNAPPFMKGWLETAPVGAARLQQFAGMTPADSFFFSAIGGDPHLLMVECYDLFAGDLRQSMEEAVQSAGRYQGMMDLLRDAGDVFSPGLCVVMRRNDYPVAEKDPVNDGAPVPLFALMGRTRDTALFDKLYTYFQGSWARFTGGAPQKQETVTLEGGAEMRSFVSPIIPGTGEIVVVRIPTLEVVIVSNSAKYVNAIFQAAFTDERSPAAARLKLSHRESFTRALASSENGAQFFAYFDPQEARHWLEQASLGTAREIFRGERESVWRGQRPELEKQQREKLFPGRNTLTPIEEGQLQDAVDQQLLASESGADARISELAEDDRRSWLPMQLLDWCSAGFRVSRRTASLVLDGQLGGG
jgi:hypothetical protein